MSKSEFLTKKNKKNTRETESFRLHTLRDYSHPVDQECIKF